MHDSGQMVFPNVLIEDLPVQKSLPRIGTKIGATNRFGRNTSENKHTKLIVKWAKIREQGAAMEFKAAVLGFILDSRSLGLSEAHFCIRVPQNQYSGAIIRPFGTEINRSSYLGTKTAINDLFEDLVV